MSLGTAASSGGTSPRTSNRFEMGTISPPTRITGSNQDGSPPLGMRADSVYRLPGFQRIHSMHTCIVGALDLGPDLRCTIRWLTQRKILKPGAHRPGSLHQGRPGDSIPKGPAHDLVRIGVGRIETKAPGPVMGRIDHGESHVDLIDHGLPELTDSHVFPIGGGDTEHVGRHYRPFLRQNLSGVAEEVRYRLGSGPAISPWKDCPVPRYSSGASGNRT